MEVRPDWLVLEQIDMSALAKLAYSVQEPETLLTAGKLVYYNKAYDRINVRMEKRIDKFENRKFFKVRNSFRKAGCQRSDLTFLELVGGKCR